MNYFKKKFFLALVDKEDNVVGKMERWQAHKKGALHRAFTVCLFFDGKVILQHRKHPVFDGVFDLTCSSHPVFVGGKIEDNLEAVYQTLRREWGVGRRDLSRPQKRGQTLYQAKDPKSPFVENEFCHFFISQVKKMPFFKPEFAYGFSLLEKEKIKTSHLPLAPWARKLIKFL